MADNKPEAHEDGEEEQVQKEEEEVVYHEIPDGEELVFTSA